MAQHATLPLRISTRALQIAAAIALTLLVALPAIAADDADAKPSESGADKVDAEKLFGAIVKVSTRAVS